ncbi:MULTISPECIES: bifunctional metallophosphatase/5'-nucleotidase [Mesonia]|uniref:Trifunctional nucleotide phosphoesterase protein YfkN n=1 Tax=Mesonia oceanica TaxID=2687242 RepID=A0AC61YC24_9FLAO|nr:MULTISPECIES: metallophosphatase [Mesonia]MAN29278.1 metallophosphatase [Mesonia sp.]MAQ39898.1 metallophosphatase [Mesonia sp.]MBJ99032.1 metallophosphatase [Flavobacteriaceae bacterium]VVV02057.1 Trifunctional nucleotide phosphoesterase protein YfkN [Mesonia oceanica]|tara:strand:+ start:15064 stop:15975 length:912 start_codon:yes stop_codon:yes gene_type:complete
MKRKTFIQNTAAAGIFTGIGGLGLLSSSFKAPAKHITILHTNDVHSHIEPFPADDAKYPNLGGISRRYSLIENIRKENPNTLLLDAGDIFQGTPFFNFYGGEIEFKLMSKLKYDAATLGNHDFDNGIDGFNAQLPNADFSFISSNYDFSNTILDGKVKDYQVFTKDGVKIGVFGLGIELDGLVSKKNYKETQYLNPVEIAQEMTKKLKQEEKCDLVICLSHLGYHYDSDKIDDLKLASQTKDIDLIIGGHTHTFLPKPTVTKNLEGKKVLVNQTGWAGVNLGRIDFYLDQENNISAEGAAIEV